MARIKVNFETNGDIFTTEQFLESWNFTDYDGWGNYATEDKE